MLFGHFKDFYFKWIVTKDQISKSKKKKKKKGHSTPFIVLGKQSMQSF